MRKYSTISLLIFLLAFCGRSSAQNNEPVALTPPDREFLQPICSPDGTKIAMAGKNYKGIWVMNADGSNLYQVCSSIAAGYRFSWSSDSQEILAREIIYQKRRRTHLIAVYNIATGERREIARSRRTLTGLPRWSADNRSIIYQTVRGLQTVPSGRSTAPLQVQSRPFTFYNEKSDFVLLDADLKVAERLTPVEGTYLNATLSPDGDKIAFELLGGPLYVVNADGTNPVDLGQGERPCWSPDGQHLAYMVTTDDGHRITGSDLYICKADGSEKSNLTHSRFQVEMNPYWTPDGQSLVYDEKTTGRIYKLALQTN